jgi:hypothetical protein
MIESSYSHFHKTIKGILTFIEYTGDKTEIWPGKKMINRIVEREDMVVKCRPWGYEVIASRNDRGEIKDDRTMDRYCKEIRAIA